MGIHHHENFSNHLREDEPWNPLGDFSKQFPPPSNQEVPVSHLPYETKIVAAMENRAKWLVGLETSNGIQWQLLVYRKVS